MQSRLLVKSDAHVVGIALLAGVSQGVVELDHLVSTVEGHLENIKMANVSMTSSFRGCIHDRALQSIEMVHILMGAWLGF